MYGNGQMNTNYGPMSLGGRDAGQQDKWEAHIKMEQQAKVAHFAQQEAAKRSPEVLDEIDQLARSTDLLEKTVETLLPRLQPVSNQCGNDAAGVSQNAPAPVLCGIAQSIRNKRQQIDYVQEQLLRAIHALEI